MKTDTKNTAIRPISQTQTRFSRLSVLGIFTFPLILTFIIMIMLIFQKTNDFPENSGLIDVKQCWARGEYNKLYSYFIKEINKFKYWQAYQAALKLNEMDKNDTLFLDVDNIQDSTDARELVEIVAQSVPKEFQDYAEKRVEFQSVIESIKQKYITLCPNRKQAENQLGSESFDIEIIKNIPNWVFASGYESAIASKTSEFTDYVEFLKLRMQGDINKDKMNDITELLSRFNYSFKQFLSRSIIRYFGRKLVGLPEIYTFAEKERQMSFDEKIRALHILFEFVRDNVAIVNADRSYVPAYPLDTLYRGYGDIESVNFLFSDLISAVLDINSFEISITNTDARPLICLLFNEKQGKHCLYGFDFRDSTPLLNSDGELLDIINFCSRSEDAEPIIVEYCPYLAEIQSGGKFNPKFYANLFQLESSVSLYLNNVIGLDIRPLPEKRNVFRNEVLLPKNVISKNLVELTEILDVWGDILPSALPQKLFMITSINKRSEYFNLLLNCKAVTVNMNTRKKLLIYDWYEDANTDFSIAETDYLAEEHFLKHINQNWLMLLNSIDSTSAMLPFQGSAALFSHILIENYRQFKISAIQALFQSGLLLYNSILRDLPSSGLSISGNAEKASVYFTDFLKKIEIEKEVQFADDVFPGALIAQARYLLAKCCNLSGNKEKAVELLEKMVDDNCKPAASKLALKYGFYSFNKYKSQTRKNE